MRGEWDVRVRVMSGVRVCVLCLLSCVPGVRIQIQETDQPGVFQVWALLGANLHRLKVIVPRVFYVNCRSAKKIEGEGVCK